MTAHINLRTSTKRHRTATPSTPQETPTQSDPKNARRSPRWVKPVGGAIAVLCLAATGILVRDASPEPSPAEPVNQGPNTDLPNVWTAEPVNQGPNTDLPTVWPAEPVNQGPNTDLPTVWPADATT